MPTLTVIAGANGSGKSTFARMLSMGSIDPDRIAATYGEGFTAAANLRASREALQLMQSSLTERQSFAVETTLAARQPLRLMAQAARLDYTLHLAFIVANAEEDTRLRIDNRVMQGGHNIPDADLERRGPRILSHLAEAVALAELSAFLVSSVQSQDFTLHGAAFAGEVQVTGELPAAVKMVLSQRFQLQSVKAIASDHAVRTAFQIAF